MTDIDDRIRAGLDADDRAFLASLDDQRGLFRQLGDSLGGPLGGWAKLVFGLTFVFGIMLVIAVWQLLQANTARDQILWAAAAIVLVMTTGFLKDWLFSRMNMFIILRELKRLELQVAMLKEDQR
ncbi:MAG TPA: DUF6768 family protein [Alteraurantiacibacter sp.]|jgi:hypothetical protein